MSPMATYEFYIDDILHNISFLQYYEDTSSLSANVGFLIQSEQPVMYGDNSIHYYGEHLLPIEVLFDIKHMIKHAYSIIAKDLEIGNFWNNNKKLDAVKEQSGIVIQECEMLHWVIKINELLNKNESLELKYKTKNNKLIERERIYVTKRDGLKNLSFSTQSTGCADCFEFKTDNFQLRDYIKGEQDGIKN